MLAQSLTRADNESVAGQPTCIQCGGHLPAKPREFEYLCGKKCQRAFWDYATALINARPKPMAASEIIEVPTVDLLALLAALEDLQPDSLSPREEAAIERLRDRLAAL